VVADIADNVCVMYGGRIVEIAPVDVLFTEPLHPYTRMLLATIPSLNGERKRQLRSIEGTVPDFSEWPQGCRFRTRCPHADAACENTPPLAPLHGINAGHTVACWHIDELEKS
jgi:peptide/nickel transport system ATP-binding protein